MKTSFGGLSSALWGKTSVQGSSKDYLGNGVGLRIALFVTLLSSLSLISCPGVTEVPTGSGNRTELLGKLTISPNINVVTGMELTATYSGTENVNYLWINGDDYVGIGQVYTPTEEGTYAVTVSAKGYQSKTSASVTVVDLANPGDPELPGAITISPNSGVKTGTLLTATYGGTENVGYQWKKDGVNIGTNESIYTPAEAGSYKVTVSASGFRSKTSESVTVTDVVTDPNPNPNPNNSTRNWTSSTTFDDTSIKGIAYGNGKFVAVGGEGKMAYSPDGTNWTPVQNSTFGSSVINSIAWGNNKFVAVGNADNGAAGKIAYSSDGVSWTAVQNSNFYNSEEPNCIYSIAYGGGKFVAIGDRGKMAYSADGISWTAVSNAPIGFYINGIAYDGNKFVVVGGNGNIEYSTNGVDWTLVNTSTGNWTTVGPFGTNTINGIAFGNGKFVAGAYNGKLGHSADGVTWTAPTTNPFSNDYNGTIYGIVYGGDTGGKFVAVGRGSKIAYSSDGNNWTAVNKSTFWDTDHPINGITYGNGKFIAVADDGKMAYSTSGTSWTAVKQ